jgi:two-component system KDP operon response regulator KdpE
MKGRKVLIVDDDAEVRRITAQVFRDAGAEITVAGNGAEGIRRFFLEKPDLVILDVMMPEMDGFEACKRIRQVASVPVILLTALNNDEEIVRGLESGADDFITKPFSPKVLLARARSVLRRLEMPQDSQPRLLYSDDYLTVDMAKRFVSVRGKPVRLTRTEYNLLIYLVQNAGWIRTFEQILENVWGPEYQGSMDYIHVYVSHLRRKIENDPKNPTYIRSEHGVGYRFYKQKG